jgi:hypothetical protein
MDNTLESQVLDEQTVQNETVAGEASQPIEDPKSELDNLIELRTGLFDVNLDADDLKWLKNSCNSKFSFKGPNDAFMLINAYLGLDAALQNLPKGQDSKTVQLTAATVEALAVLVNRYEGSGIGPAQKIFKVAVSLQQVITIMRDLDQQINALEQAMTAQNESEPEQEKN